MIFTPKNENISKIKVMDSKSLPNYLNYQNNIEFDNKCPFDELYNNGLLKKKINIRLFKDGDISKQVILSINEEDYNRNILPHKESITALIFDGVHYTVKPTN